MRDDRLPEFHIDMQPVGRRIDIRAGQTILQAAQAAGVGLVSLCAGEGWCESCKVRMASGEVAPPTQSELDALTNEELAAGFRLACQVVPRSDVRVDIPPASLSTPQRLQIEGKDFEIPLAPIVDWVDLELTPPNLQDLRADVSRLKDGLAERDFPATGIALPVMQNLSPTIRELGWSIRAVLREGEVIAILPPGHKLYGLAIDIGTTKLAAYLVDLASGEIVGKTGQMNPQIAYGEDVVSRIGYANQHHDGRGILQRDLVEAINQTVHELCVKASLEPRQIVDAVIVGNTAMHHLFAGLPVEQLVFSPYVPATIEPLDLRSLDIGMHIAPGAYIHLLPNIAGYVGADHSAVILSTGLWKKNANVMAIDIGTNTEISLISSGRIVSCSCASGPAFEGAHIKHGMRAAAGAIERIQMIDGQINLFTIDKASPVGICGSGILDAVAQLAETGQMDFRGAFIEGEANIRKNENGQLEFLLAPAETTGNARDIVVTRKDISEIQLAKAAIRAGQEILLKSVEIDPEDLDEVLIAGAFGTYLDIPNAISIGMFPDIPESRFQQIGNAAGMGAVQALLSRDYRKLIRDVIRGVEYIELTTYSDFQNEYVKAMYLQ